MDSTTTKAEVTRRYGLGYEPVSDPNEPDILHAKASNRQDQTRWIPLKRSIQRN